MQPNHGGIFSRLDVNVRRLMVFATEKEETMAADFQYGGHEPIPFSLFLLPATDTDILTQRIALLQSSWRAPQFPRDFKAIEGQRHSAKLPDLITKHGLFDKFLAPSGRACFRM
jgi:hypothetical protein